MSIIKNITDRSYTQDRPANILSSFYDGKFEYALAKTGHNIYGAIKTSEKVFFPPVSQMPSNFHFIPETLENIRIDIPFDFVLTHNRGNAFQFYKKTAEIQHIPLVVVHHQSIEDKLTANVFLNLSKRCVHVTDQLSNQFLTKNVIHTCVDFPSAIPFEERKLLLGTSSVFSNEDYNEIRHRFKSMADNEFFLNSHQKPLFDEEYMNGMSNTKVYINFVSESIIPYDMAQAMACGCAVFSIRNKAVESILPDECLFDSSKSLLVSVKELVHAQDKLKQLGIDNAIKAKEMFDEAKFISQWKELIEDVRYRIFKV